MEIESLYKNILFIYILFSSFKTSLVERSGRIRNVGVPRMFPNVPSEAERSSKVKFFSF